MNSLIQQQWPVLEQTQALREQMMDMLTDEDLKFKLPGANITLGELCRECGEMQYSYIQSFKTFKHDFSYRNTSQGLDTSVDKLKAWYTELDKQFKATIEALTEEDIQSKMIDRGGFTPPIGVQFHVYREGLLIFYGKASIYLKALGKTYTEQWREWIA